MHLDITWQTTVTSGPVRVRDVEAVRAVIERYDARVEIDIIDGEGNSAA